MSKKPTKADYEQIGRVLEWVYESGYASRKRMYKLSFVKGLFAGLGGVIGASIVVGLLLWILSLFDSLPLVGPFVESFEETVREAR